MNMMSVKPVKPIAPYVGGKSQLAKTIIKRIDALEHKSYVEPFCGMGGVFLRRTSKPPSEVINDYNGDVANLFRMLQRHHSALIEMIGYTVSSRAEFERQKALPTECLTDLERAVRFLYLQRTAFGGKVRSQAFGICGDGRRSRFNPLYVEQFIQALRHRLAGVVIENLDYAECISRYDTPTTLFYLDPPYWGSENYYGEELFSRDEYVKMADQLASIKGQFILSINDTPEIRDIFSQFHFEELSVRYTLAKSNNRKFGELIISSRR